MRGVFVCGMFGLLIGGVDFLPLVGQTAAAMPFPAGINVYEYSEIFTNATSVPPVTNGCCSTFNARVNAYSGWLGVNGALQVLGSAGAMQANDHALVSLAAAGSTGFLQAGAYKGKVFESQVAPQTCLVGTCVNSPNSYSVYFEIHEGSFASILSFGGAGSAANIFRIQQPGGSWHIYDLYNNEFTGPDYRIWHTGQMYAAVENMAYNRTSVNFAPTNSYFGNSNSASNSALRLLGATGYKPRDGALVAGYTMQVSDTTVSPAFNQNIYSTYYEWGAF